MKFIAYTILALVAGFFILLVSAGSTAPVEQKALTAQDVLDQQKREKRAAYEVIVKKQQAMCQKYGQC